jgi:hypothetical protein
MSTAYLDRLSTVAHDALKAFTHLELARMHWRHGELATRDELYQSAASIAIRLGRECSAHQLPMPICSATSSSLKYHYALGERIERNAPSPITWS